MGVFGGPEKDREFCSGESVVVHSIVATASAILVVSTGAILVVSTLRRLSCLCTSVVAFTPVAFDIDGFPCLVCCPLHPAAGGSDSRPLLW